MNRRIYIPLATLLFTAFVLSCTEDLDESNGVNTGDLQTIKFAVDDSQDWMQTDGIPSVTRTLPTEVSGHATDAVIAACVVSGIPSEGLNRQEKDTRGIALTSLTSTIGLSGYELGTTDEWGTQYPTFFYNKTATLTGNVWKMDDKDYFWPSPNRALRFYGYSPCDNSNVKLSPSSYPGTPYIEFEADKTIESQVDLMTAVSPITSRTANDVVMSLPFKHALTCVKFAVGSGLDQDRTIVKIRLTKIVRKGTYHIGADWDLSTDEEDFWNYNIEGFSVPIATSENTIITHPEKGANATTLLMIPQHFDRDDQTIEITYDNGTVLSAKLTGTEWLAGTSVTYYISSVNTNWDYHLEVMPVTVGHNGGEAAFSVSSYYEVAGVRRALGWKVTGYSMDGGKTFTDQLPDSCDWLAVLTRHGSGGAEPEYGKLTILEQQGKTSSVNETQDNEAQITLMQKRGVQGSNSNYLDLSKRDVAGHMTYLQNTANCYIINAPGYYKLPLVYGNAIQNGKDISDTYSKAKTPSQDYLGNEITSPYVYNSGTVGDAIILWQDSENLIKNVKLCDTGDDAGKYLQFFIDSLSIHQGNAVVAVRDNTSPNKRIMWSWHIWVTGIDVMETVKIYDAKHSEYELMPVYLGWCSKGGSMTTYPGREVIVRIQQQGGKLAYLPVTQLKGVSFDTSELADGNAPFYQWGRKDPFVGYKGLSDSNVKDHWAPEDNKYKLDISSSSNTVTISTSIQNPHTFYSVTNKSIESHNDWCSTHESNRWNAGSAAGPANWDAKVKKTIYDPSPVGFTVPDQYVFTGLGDGGETLTSTVQYSSLHYAKAFNKGAYFYMDGTKNKTICFPATGWIEGHTGNAYNVGTGCGVWLAQASLYNNNQTYRSYFTYYSSTSCSIHWNSGTRSYGMPQTVIRERK